MSFDTQAISSMERASQATCHAGAAACAGVEVVVGNKVRNLAIGTCSHQRPDCEQQAAERHLFALRGGGICKNKFEPIPVGGHVRETSIPQSRERYPRNRPA
jgi:hypothetical protein